MIAIPIADTNTLARTPYWFSLIGIHFFMVIVEGVVTDPDVMLPGAMLALSAASVGALIWITYLRVKDIGWHGAHALWCFIPLGNIVLGFFKTGYAYRNLELMK